MPVAKIYNPDTSAWEPAIIGKEGPQGTAGPTGPAGTDGTEGEANFSSFLFIGA
jgi:hypothetical protein